MLQDASLLDCSATLMVVGKFVLGSLCVDAHFPQDMINEAGIAV